VGSPPPPEEIVGTMNYYSPELVRYIQGSAEPGELTQAADIFALGLIYAEYLTASLPAFDPAHRTAAMAVLHGQVLALGPSRAPQPVRDLVERMLLPDPTARPDVAAVHATLMGLRGAAGAPARTRATMPKPVRPPMVPKAGAAAAAPTGARAGAAAPSALRGKGVRLAGTTARGPLPAAPAAPTAPPAPARPRPERPADDAGRGAGSLLGKLLGRRPEGGLR
jgi:hypothetical protein